MYKTIIPEKIFFLGIILLVNASAFSAVHVIMDTSKGTIELELNDELAPITVHNFLE